MIDLLIYWGITAVCGLVLFGLVRALETLTERTRWTVLALIALSYALLLWLLPDNAGLSDAAVLLVAAAAGWLIGRGLGSSQAVMVFVITTALVDYFSFSGGLTRRIIEAAQSGSSNLFGYLVIQAPVAGRMVAVVGLGDLLILAALITALTRLGYRPWAAIGIPLAGLLLAIAVGTLLGGIFGLPFLALSVLIGLWLVKPATQSPG